MRRASVKQLQGYISEFNKVELKDYSIDDLKEKLECIFFGYSKLLLDIAPGATFYRGRLFTNTRPTNIKDLTYPPKNLIKALQRTNRVNQSRFYCSLERRSPFFELGVQPGNFIVLSEWKTNKNLFANHIGYSSDQLINKFPKADSSLLNKDIMTKINSKQNNIVNEFIATEFKKIVPIGKEYLYKLTVAIAEKNYNSDQFQGLLYPTIPMKSNSENLVIKPEYVDESLKFIKAEYIFINSVRGFKIGTTLLDSTKLVESDGSLIWNKDLENYIIKSDNNQFEIIYKNNKWNFIEN